MNAELNFFEELDLNEKTKRQIIPQRTSLLSVVKMNFKTGILVGVFSTILLVSMFGFTSFKTENNFEVVALQLDSIQISQNDRIIKLLENKEKGDTIIVHIVAPSL
jgi:hypothetical protein